MKIICITLFFSIISSFCFSQNFNSSYASSVISSQGGFNQNNSISLAWTLGENFIETEFIKEGIITQGFQQSFFNENSTLDLEIVQENLVKSVVFPNPVTNKLYIKLDVTPDSRLNVKLFDITGKFLIKSLANIKGPNFWINLVGCSPGVYILQITDDYRPYKKVYQIIKN
jgi:hypothetical protein